MRKIRLTESELTNIIRKIIQEQPKLDKQYYDDYYKATQGKYGQSVGPGIKMGETSIPKSVTMGVSLFANGISKIDTNSNEYKKGITAINDAIKSTGNDSMAITVEGGASAVGAPTFDNEGLARKRAENFINSIKPQFPNVKFSVKTKVGVATGKGTPEANAEQYVKLFFYVPGMKVDRMGPAIDNTQLAMRMGVNKIPEVKKQDIIKEKMVRICFDIPEKYLPEFEALSKKIGGKTVSGGSGYKKPEFGGFVGRLDKI